MGIPIYLRLIIYFLVAAGLSFVESSEGIVPANMDWFQWVRLWVSVGVQGLIVVKAYVDTTYASSVYDAKKEKLKNETQIFNNSNPSIKP